MKCLKEVNRLLLLTISTLVISLLSLINLFFDLKFEISINSNDNIQNVILAMSGIIGTIVAISLPIGIQTISSFKNDAFAEDLRKSFTAQTPYKMQLVNFVFIFLNIILSFFFTQFSEVVWFSLFTLLFSLISLVSFILLVQKYSLSYLNLLNTESMDLIDQILE